MTYSTYVSGLLQVRAYRVLQKHVYTVLQRFELKPTHWFILGYIKQGKEVSSAEIADFLKVEPPHITGLTEELLRKDLIQKIPHPKDGRVKLLKTTRRCDKLMPQIETALEASITRLLQGAPTKDLRAYKRVLEVIIMNDGPK